MIAKLKSIISVCLIVFSLTSIKAQSLDGKWKINANIKSMGEMQILLDFEKTSDSTFYASSRSKALKEVVGGIKYAVAKRSKTLKNGSIVHIYNGIIKGDSLKGIMTTPAINLYFSAKLENGKMQGALFGNNKEEIHEFTAVPFANEYVDYNYPELINSIKNTFQENIYSHEILTTKEWRKFFKRLDNIAPNIRDDIEMFMYFSFLAGKIKMSHINILKHNPWDDYDKDGLSNYIPIVNHKMLNDETAYIKFEGFQLADTAVIRNFFKTIIDEKIPNLIYDFRSCGGGDYSSMFLAKYLTKEPHDAGFFVGNKYFKNNQQLPDETTIKNLPVYAGKSLKDFLQTIIDSGLLKGEVVPDKELFYNGNVYALIDNYSASATEPIAYFLKQHKLAALVGETTAGAMLSSTVITVKDSWSLMLPIADYYTSDRFRIEQKGVKPDFKVKSKDALDFVLEKIAAQ